MAKLAKRLCVCTPAKAAGYFGCWWKFNHPSLTEQFSLSEQLVSCFSYWNALGREALHLLQFAVHWPWLAVHVCHWCLLLWCLCALVHGSSERPPRQTRWWLGTSVTAPWKAPGCLSVGSQQRGGSARGHLVGAGCALKGRGCLPRLLCSGTCRLLPLLLLRWEVIFGCVLLY